MAGKRRTNPKLLNKNDYSWIDVSSKALEEKGMREQVRREDQR